jgi:hypothetical protein
MDFDSFKALVRQRVRRDLIDDGRACKVNFWTDGADNWVVGLHTPGGNTVQNSISAEAGHDDAVAFVDRLIASVRVP